MPLASFIGAATVHCPVQVQTGWYMYEEINKIDQGKNYGWPCTEGPILSPHYNDPDEAGAPFHGNKACQDLVAGDKWERPFYAYAHPIPNPPHNGETHIRVRVMMVCAARHWTSRVIPLARCLLTPLQ